jgi:6-phosphogluconolactonase (cycloisomerase 2 family)
VNVIAALLAALLLGATAGAAGGPPAGSLVDIGGPGGCVAQPGDVVGIEQHDPTADGCAVGRGLQLLHHVALSPDSRFVYTAAGDPSKVGDDESAIAIFARNAATGAVRQLAGEAGCVERESPPRDLGCAQARNITGLRFVRVSADGRFLYASGATGIAVFRREPATGGLSQLPGTAGCLSDTTDGCTFVNGAQAVEDVLIAGRGTQAYAVSSDGYVMLFGRDPATGQLQPRGCIGENSRGTARQGCAGGHGIDKARSLALSPDGRFVYVPSLGDSLAIFARDARTGRLTQLPLPAGCISETRADGCAGGRAIFAPHRLSITRDGRFAYLAGKRADNKGSSVVIFRRDIRTGALRQLPGTAGCFTEDGSDGCALGRVIRGAHAAILDGSERTIYVASDRNQGGIAVFRRDPATGQLTQLPGRYGCLSPIAWQGCAQSRRMGGIHFVALSGDGRFLYAAGENSEALVVLRIAK